MFFPPSTSPFSLKEFGIKNKSGQVLLSNIGVRTISLIEGWSYNSLNLKQRISLPYHFSTIRRGLAHDELNHRKEAGRIHKWKHEKTKLIDKEELWTYYTPTRKWVNLKHHQSNPNSNSLRTNIHAHLWKNEMEWEL